MSVPHTNIHLLRPSAYNRNKIETLGRFLPFVHGFGKKGRRGDCLIGINNLLQITDLSFILTTIVLCSAY